MDLLRRVWWDPRETVRDAASALPRFLFVLLAGVYGATHNLGIVLGRGADASLGLGRGSVVVINLIVGFIFGAVSLYAVAFPLSWVGKWLGGVGRPRDIRSVLALAAVPYIPLLGATVALAVFGPSDLIIRSDGHPLEVVKGGWGTVVALYYALVLVLGAWLVTIGIVGLSEVHAISTSRSFAVYLITGAGLFVIVLLGIGAVVLLRGGA